MSNAEESHLDGDPRQILEAAFAPGGLVSRFVAGYEDRPEQVRMALSVWDTLADGGRLLVEAGTGVGKSLAYLLPAILWAKETRKRIVVSTHTVNLQSQLFSKDLPLVSQMLSASDWGFEYALFKGRSHYLCMRRWRQSYADVAQKTSLCCGDRGRARHRGPV